MYHRTAAEQEIIDSISNYFAQLDWLDVGVRVVAVLGLIAVAYISWPRKKEPRKKKSVVPSRIGGGRNNNAITSNVITSRGKTSAELREESIETLFTKYLDSVLTYLNQFYVRGANTNKVALAADPNEKLMRAIEETIHIPEQGVDDFRRALASFVCVYTAAGTGKKMTSRSHPQLRLALERYQDITRAPGVERWHKMPAYNRV